MKIFFRRLLILFFIMISTSVAVCAVPTLIPGGQVIGLQLQDGSVTVSSLDEAMGIAAKQAGLQPGDRLMQINDTPIQCIEDVRNALTCSQGDVCIHVERGNRTEKITFTPVKTENGPKLGVYLRQGLTGLGTVTYYDPRTDEFATLGHGVNHPDGQLAVVSGGNAFGAKVYSVKKGKIGKPGQLLGSLTEEGPLGQLSKNSQQGVFGKIASKPTSQPLPVGQWEEIRTGQASIRCTIDDHAPREYSVEILKIYPNRAEKTRNMLIKVTDPALLETTGGIVQGMSGSPIIQDGKLVGAVTHVLVNDPTTGYGIFIENMLDAAA